jgi:hypothetical protein
MEVVALIRRVSKIIAEDEAWRFQYDTESKGQILQCKQPTFPRPKKVRVSKSQIKTMLITFSIPKVLFTLNSFYKVKQ